MTLSSEHEKYKSLFGLIVFFLARFFGKKIASFGSFTHQRDDLEKGLEPDECFYLASLTAVRGKKEIDLERDPPPDLAIEIDVKASSLDRMAIYAALKVPEVWRFDGRKLQVFLLQEGNYQVREFSPNFPGVPVADLVQFLELGIDEDETTMAQALEKWLGKITKGKRRKKP